MTEPLNQKILQEALNYNPLTEAQEVITTAREQYHGEYARHY